MSLCSFYMTIETLIDTAWWWPLRPNNIHGRAPIRDTCVEADTRGELLAELRAESQNNTPSHVISGPKPTADSTIQISGGPLHLDQGLIDPAAEVGSTRHTTCAFSWTNAEKELTPEASKALAAASEALAHSTRRSIERFPPSPRACIAQWLVTRRKSIGTGRPGSGA